MKIRSTLAAAARAITLVGAAGCAVTRGQETVGAYVDDSAITAAVKSRMLADETEKQLSAWESKADDSWFS